MPHGNTKEKGIGEILKARLREAGLLDELVTVLKPYGVKIEDVLSRSRLRRVTRARRAICWHLRTNHHYSYPEIGRTLGIDHSTVIYAVRTYEKEVSLAF